MGRVVIGKTKMEKKTWTSWLGNGDKDKKPLLHDRSSVTSPTDSTTPYRSRTPPPTTESTMHFTPPKNSTGQHQPKSEPSSPSDVCRSTAPYSALRTLPSTPYHPTPGTPGDFIDKNIDVREAIDSTSLDKS